MERSSQCEPRWKPVSPPARATLWSRPEANRLPAQVVAERPARPFIPLLILAIWLKIPAKSPGEASERGNVFLPDPRMLPRPLPRHRATVWPDNQTDDSVTGARRERCYLFLVTSASREVGSTHPFTKGLKLWPKRHVPATAMLDPQVEQGRAEAAPGQRPASSQLKRTSRKGAGGRGIRLPAWWQRVTGPDRGSSGCSGEWTWCRGCRGR